MEPEDDKPIALDAYQSFADRYAERIDTKSWNAYLERPGTLSLLPDVKGKRVLDAGCGPGVYTEWLLDHGASVIAVDVSSKMIELAKKRIGDRADIRLTDLRKPLSFIADASVDVVLSPLVLDYIKDWQNVFKEFFRVLRPGGTFVFSVTHPFSPINLKVMQDYHQIEYYEYPWRGFGDTVIVPSYRRPFRAIFTPLRVTGFLLDAVLEPLPTEKFQELNPEDYSKALTTATFLCLRVLKPKE